MHAACLGDLQHAEPTKTEFEAVVAVLHVALIRITGHRAHHELVEMGFVARTNVLPAAYPKFCACFRLEMKHLGPKSLLILAWLGLLHYCTLFLRFLTPQRSTVTTSRRQCGA